MSGMTSGDAGFRHSLQRYSLIFHRGAAQRRASDDQSLSSKTTGAPVRICWGLLIGLLLATGCNQPQAAPPEAPPPTVRYVEVGEADVVDFEYFTGRTDATETVEVRARVTGYLTSFGFKPGDDVKKGQTLFQIDPRPYQAELNRVQSQVLLSEAKLGLAQADVTRAEDIAKTPGAISRQDIDRYVAARAEADAALKASKAMVETAALNVEFAEVKSPIDGRVGRNLLTEGNLVVQDQTLLTTIVSEDPMFVYFDVDERTMLRIQQMLRDGEVKGREEIEIRVGLANEGTDYPHAATLDFVNNRVSSSTGTLQIRAALKNPVHENGGPRLFTPGLFVRVRLTVGKPHKGLVVAQAAITAQQSQKFLLVVGENNIVEQRPIVTGPIQPDGRQQIEPVMVIREETAYRPARPGEKGEPSIKPGDKAIVGGMQRVRTGAEVNPSPYEEGQTP